MDNALPLLYLDSPVPSAYYNDHDPERQIVTQRIWHTKLPNYRPVISNITQRKLAATKNRKRRKKLRRLVQYVKRIIILLGMATSNGRRFASLSRRRRF
jgi:hypothetical protein